MPTANNKTKLRHLILVCFSSKRTKFKVFELEIRGWSAEIGEGVGAVEETTALCNLIVSILAACRKTPVSVAGATMGINSTFSFTGSGFLLPCSACPHDLTQYCALNAMCTIHLGFPCINEAGTIKLHLT